MHWINRLSRSSQLFVAILLLGLGAGCEESKPPIVSGPSDQIDDVDEIRRFYPMTVGDIRRYMVTGGVELEYETTEVVQKTAGPEATIEVRVQGQTHFEYMRWSNDNLLSSNSADHTSEFKELAGPLYQNADWRKINQSNDNTIFYIDSRILDMAYPISVEAGTFNSLVVQEIKHSQFPPLPENIDTSYVYFVQDVGIVRWDLGGLVYDLVEYTPGDGETD